MVEKYKDFKQTNEDGIGIDDFVNKIVLRFRSEHEISLYFEIVDQLTQIVVLKGRKVLLEKEHYSEIMSRYLEVCKNYMLFLCKDEAYTSYINQYKSGEEVSQEEDHGQDSYGRTPEGTQGLSSGYKF